ncbi:FAD/NAD(P)-binding protein [Aquabacterium sp.]|uniref:FAD/NAD(P)-binding protein n=1 Tax=Aquabacterium sp. TaxID=1872578 RepID=UPI002BC7CC60|nr:FAD/NAD(P)-binding protein [Aquabacterium sp.]HSW08149.1 FAD/NAD(P)-binding protein [Aquabacterium sp.]
MTFADLPNARPPRRVAIVGAGFSGAVTAIQLLRHAPPEGLQVVLINESGRMARGLAYGTHSNAHVLNVPAGNMSALADDAEDFVRYCRWSDPRIEPGSFVSRRLYGAYLEALLSAAELQNDGQTTLERIVGRVIGLHTEGPGGRAELLLEQGSSLLADRVVLAFGHFTPIDPLPAAAVAEAGARYIRDPWRPGALHGIQPADDVLLVGAGLTAVDVALALSSGPRGGRLLSISRRGLAPQSHRKSGAAPGTLDASALAAEMGHTVRQQCRVLRQHVQQALARGEDWRDVIGALRPHTAALWQRLSPADRARFLRHPRAHWEVLRHRCAPSAHDAYQRLVDTDALNVMAARVASVQAVADGLQLQLRPRGAQAVRELKVQHIVNCTGPSADLQRCPSPLVRGLLQAGRLCPDPLGLGLVVDEQYAVLDRAGRPSALLSYIGPLLKARDWEATAVPELRLHARRLALQLLGRQ